ncbi:(4Fe-4S)-binding protein [miscellaneous Crenarchaeota group archaeon SMTZ1-55]|nr:MAG: (4Fe-4S)-binding protein [miscellaneous Crenarchaeota group archaeon SMTZ1-55]
MRQITVLSGKGGTGKTSLTAAFAALTRHLVIGDCDVDAPNLHLLLNPTIVETQEFRGSQVAVIDETKCVQCGKCEAACRFHAIHDLVIDPVLCEGCGVCAYLCPTDAITLDVQLDGYAFISTTKYGPMAHARLNPGQENSGKLVTLVRQNARRIAEKEKIELVLIDGPPGIGCPVIASITGVDAGLIVVEPTLSGIHDLERALSLLNHFRIPAFVCVNKADLNAENTARIIAFCEDNEVRVIGRIPFDPLVTKAMVAATPVVEYAPTSRIADEIKNAWTCLRAAGTAR